MHWQHHRAGWRPSGGKRGLLEDATLGVGPGTTRLTERGISRADLGRQAVVQKRVRQRDAKSSSQKEKQQNRRQTPRGQVHDAHKLSEKLGSR